MTSPINTPPTSPATPLRPPSRPESRNGSSPYSRIFVESLNFHVPDDDSPSIPATLILSTGKQFEVTIARSDVAIVMQSSRIFATFAGSRPIDKQSPRVRIADDIIEGLLRDVLLTLDA